jgi:5-methylcytosine-specific restriction protein B
MSRVPGNDALYVVTDAFRDRCLARDDSLFTPGRPIWTADTAQYVATAVAEDDTSSREFVEKLVDHVAPLPAAAMQLGAEILYLVLLPEHDTGAPRKLEHITKILSLSSDGVEIPVELRVALGHGFATYGQGGRAHRHESIRYMARFALHWKQLPAATRGAMLVDPWTFRDFVSDVESGRADTQRSALLHIVFPDTFESIVSRGAKERIVAGFSDYVNDPDAPLDRQLADIRSGLEPDHGEGFDYWQPELMGVWSPVDSPSPAEEDASERLAHSTVEAAVRALAAMKLKPASESMLRVFLAFKAIHRQERETVTGQDIEHVVKELFTLLPTPLGMSDSKVTGTIRLRGNKAGGPDWMRNDSYRGAFQNNAGPKGTARVLFVDDDWHKPLHEDAVDTVVANFDASRNTWPPRDVLAAIALRNDIVDADATWTDLEAVARQRFGVSEGEWKAVTSAPALSVSPLGGPPWDPSRLAPDLRPPGAEHAERSERQIEQLPEQLAREVERVIVALTSYGRSAIVALAGVPGTSKSHVARLAARAFASEGCLTEIQFSPGYTYEEFMEGPRYGAEMKVEIMQGAFLELNRRAMHDPANQYVMLIEEFTRADLPRVLGELLTFVEYRDEDDDFTTLYTRDATTRVAQNLALLATYNPSDRSAINLDAALIRRLRILDFPPDMSLLREILRDNGVDSHVSEGLVAMFDACRAVAGDRFEETMPFGHAMFASVSNESDLYALWRERIKHMLVRPHAPRHELYPTILEHYPWHQSAAVSVVPVAGAEQLAGGGQDSTENPPATGDGSATAAPDPASGWPT